MNTAVAVAFAAMLAVANAGFLAAPAYGPAVVAAPALVRTAPVIVPAGIAYTAHGIAPAATLVRVGRSANPGLLAAPAVAPVAVSYSSGIVRGAPVAYAAAPVAYAPAAKLVRVGRSANPGLLAAPAVAPVAVSYSSGIVRGAPVAYAAAPVAYAHGPVALAPAAKLVRVGRSANPGLLAASPVAYAHAPVAYAAAPAIGHLSYAAPVAYAAPVPVAKTIASPVLLG